MKPADREKWIMQRLALSPEIPVDILDAHFVMDYIEATDARFGIQPFGAHKCPALGRDLARLYRKGKLHRSATGLAPGDSSMGFPKWIYTYRINKRYLPVYEDNP